MSRKWLVAWTDDRFTEDDLMLIGQLCQRALSRRGIHAAENEILVALGAQNALCILSSLLVKPGTPVAIKEPGYPDIRNILGLMGADIRATPVDSDGVAVDRLGDASIALVTPSHQAPTNTTMSLQRRYDLLDQVLCTEVLVESPCDTIRAGEDVLTY